jgi:hypothetical protein
MRLEGLRKLKKKTSSEIVTATLRLVGRMDAEQKSK